MNKSIVLNKKQQYAAVASSVAISFLVVWAMVSGATTISTNVSTGGTLSVTGTSTLTGVTLATGGFVSSASSTVAGTLAVNGQLQASSTLLANGLTTLTGGFVSSASSTVNSNVLIVGVLNASSTIAVSGDIIASSTNATTTLQANSGGGNRGGCIQLQSATGTPYRLYIGANDTATNTTGATANGRSGIIAVWEQGSCK